MAAITFDHVFKQFSEVTVLVVTTQQAEIIREPVDQLRIVHHAVVGIPARVTIEAPNDD
ncbi:MAG TPA: hypothetical protein VFU22_04620 [Roseiflexaceae bacterium]|nr:hypothetical protein [Roseiflexaceae bacterium]